MSAIPVSGSRQPGFMQGLMLLLPITMAVVGVSVFTATVAQMQDNFKAVPHGDYLVNFLQTMPGAWIFLFSPAAGWLADRFGRRTILLWAMVIYAAVGVAPFFLNNLYLILVTRCGVGICESIVMTVTTTMINDYFKGQSRERWLAGQTGTASLSALIIIPLGGYLGATYGWHGPFLVYLYSLLLVIGVAVFCWEPAKEGAAEAAANPDDSQYVVFPWARMLGICAITLVGSVMFYTTITQNANMLVSLGITNPAKISVYADLASIGVPIGTVVFWLIGRTHIGWLLVIDFLLIGVGFMFMGRATTPANFVWAADIQQIGCGLILPTLLVWASRGLPYSIRGRGAGMWQGAFAVGFFFSGATLTFLSKQFGSLPAAFSALGMLCLVAAAAALIAKFIWGRAPLSVPVI